MMAASPQARHSKVKMNIKWEDKPQKHDYPAAVSYLSLTMNPKAAKNAVGGLEVMSICRV